MLLAASIARQGAIISQPKPRPVSPRRPGLATGMERLALVMAERRRTAPADWPRRRPFSRLPCAAASIADAGVLERLDPRRVGRLLAIGILRFRDAGPFAR